MFSNLFVNMLFPILIAKLMIIAVEYKKEGHKNGIDVFVSLFLENNVLQVIGILVFMVGYFIYCKFRNLNNSILELKEENKNMKIKMGDIKKNEGKMAFVLKQYSNVLDNLKMEILENKFTFKNERNYIEKDNEHIKKKMDTLNSNINKIRYILNIQNTLSLNLMKMVGCGNVPKKNMGVVCSRDDSADNDDDADVKSEITYETDEDVEDVDIEDYEDDDDDDDEDEPDEDTEDYEDEEENNNDNMDIVEDSFEDTPEDTGEDPTPPISKQRKIRKIADYSQIKYSVEDTENAHDIMDIVDDTVCNTVNDTDEDAQEDDTEEEDDDSKDEDYIYEKSDTESEEDEDTEPEDDAKDVIDQKENTEHVVDDANDANDAENADADNVVVEAVDADDDADAVDDATTSTASSLPLLIEQKVDIEDKYQPLPDENTVNTHSTGTRSNKRSYTNTKGLTTMLQYSLYQNINNELDKIVDINIDHDQPKKKVKTEEKTNIPNLGKSTRPKNRKYRK